MTRLLTQTAIFSAGLLFATPSVAATIYNNLTPNNLIGVATRPDSAGGFEIEAGDDFLLGSRSLINMASFTGLIVPGTGGSSSVNQLVVEIYRVFPLDSDQSRTPRVPTRANSPSDIAFTSKDGSAGELSYTASTLSASFSVLNSIQPGGIHASPGQTTLGNGPLSGQEVQFNVAFTTPFDLPADHYFFVPQVSLTNGAQFYWLSASRPISGPGTTPFATDLQEWTRDANLNPDWLRVGTDIVGGSPAPTFNGSFSLSGSTVPEPSTIFLSLAGAGLVAIGKYRRR